MAELGDHPHMSKFQAELAKLAMIKKERAKHLTMSLEEKIAENHKREKPVLLSEIESWASLGHARSDKGKHDHSVQPSDDISKKVSLWRGDITTLAVGAICNAAKRSLLGGGNGWSVVTMFGLMDVAMSLDNQEVDGSIHRGAGKHLYNECESLCGCNTGEAKMTGGYLLPAKYVIHTVGPHMHFDGGGGNDRSKRELLVSCYQSCLNLVLEHNKKQKELQAHLSSIDHVTDNLNGVDIGPGVRMDTDQAEMNGAKMDTNQGCDDNGRLEIKRDLNQTSSSHHCQVEPLIDSIAFPCISTGSYGYPQEEAAHVALSVCRDWLEKHPEELQRIIFCVFLESDYDIYMKLLPQYFPLEVQGS